MKLMAISWLLIWNKILTWRKRPFNLLTLSTWIIEAKTSSPYWLHYYILPGISNENTCSQFLGVGLSHHTAKSWQFVNLSLYSKTRETGSFPYWWYIHAECNTESLNFILLYWFKNCCSGRNTTGNVCPLWIYSM